MVRCLMAKIFDKLGGGFGEAIYQNAYELRCLSSEVPSEVSFPVLYDDTKELGVVRFDLLVCAAH